MAKRTHRERLIQANQMRVRSLMDQIHDNCYWSMGCTSYIERWDRLSIHYNILSSDTFGVWVNHNRVAVDSYKRAEYLRFPFTELNDCEICGRRSTPKNVCGRSDIYRWNRTAPNDWSTPSKDRLCVSC